MATALKNTQTCTRCNGTGKYSFNLKDGDVCYGCGGQGSIVVAPKGQKKVKPTVESVHKAGIGDILEIACVLYRIESITWIAYRMYKGEQVNQRMVLTRLVDNKTTYLGRIALYQEGANKGTAIHPTAEMVGKEV